MKQEIKDIAANIVYQAPASVVAWWQQLSLTTAIAITLGVLQILYLLRKWWREETDWGQKLKRRARGYFTKPGDL
ncbi:hypothetical protein C7T35_15495 [Variovorax sp. WS11]|uniref:hypothetical protein n=1 Tax=Variovorax sp. WS11 TaxID=1105204 RepID=UPI000D0D629C|nr:hypothetical protein [Variovorax sp. WS11]NDZ12033.1 hypothetical protein [Variovorax sp. WS11]PSL83782.1 hypothetical protein C7T35_15495 [Variovorax sp. WS11]